MKKSVIALGVIAAALLVVVIVLGVRYHQQSGRLAETRDSEDAVKGQFNAALESIAEIQDSLNAVAPAEAKVVSLSQNAETGSAVTQSQKDQMLGTISGLKQSIDNSKKRISQLEKDLKNSRSEVSGLKRIIDNLKRSVAEKEVTITRLTSKVDSLNVTVAGLQTDVARGQQTIAQQQGVIQQKTREIGTIYYCVGTKKDLKAKGIVSDKGGVVGIGKTHTLTGAFQAGDFTAFDTDAGKEIAIAGREPEVLSAQSRSSYEIQPDGDNFKLVIKDSAEFRKVKYLVIMVKEK